MKLHNLTKVDDREVEEWLITNVKGMHLHPWQIEALKKDEIVRYSPFYFFKVNPKVSNPLLRLTIIFIPLVWLLVFITLPVNFIITGRWGYSNLGWYLKWTHSVGL